MYRVWIGVVALLVAGLALLALYVRAFNRHQDMVNQIVGEWQIRLPEGPAPAYLAKMASPVTFRADGTGSMGKSRTFKWSVGDEGLVIDGGKPMPILELNYRHLTYRSGDGPVELTR